MSDADTVAEQTFPGALIRSAELQRDVGTRLTVVGHG